MCAGKERKRDHCKYVVEMDVPLAVCSLRFSELKHFLETGEKETRFI